MVGKRLIKKYYSSDKFKPWLPEFSSWRQYKFLTDKGMRKIHERIANANDLRKYLLKYLPYAVYYTSSKWLNPSVVASKNAKKGYKYADKCILGMDMVFDIDVKNKEVMLESLEEARKATLILLEIVEKDYKLNYILFTGNKGFQISFTDKFKLPIPIEQREQEIEKNRKIYIDKLSKDLFDWRITVDTRRVIRLPNSINGVTGYICTILSKKELEKPIIELIKDIPYVGERPVIPLTGKMMSPPRTKITEGLTETGLRSPSHYYAIFMTNQVKKRRIPFFCYDKKGGYERELLFLQKSYQLGNVYIFKIDNLIYAFSIKTFDKRRLQKIYNRSHSLIKWEQEKYGRSYMRISSKFQDLEVLKKASTYLPYLIFYFKKEKDSPKYIKTLKQEDNSFVSRAHLENFLRVYNIKDKFKNVHNNINLKITIGKVRS